MTKNSESLLNQIFYGHGFLLFRLIHMKTCCIVLIPFLETILLYQFISLLILTFSILFNYIMLFYVQKQTFLTLTSYIWCNSIVYILYMVLRANIKFLAYPLGQLNIACIHRLQKVSCDTRPQLMIKHYNMIFPRFTAITQLIEVKFYAIYILYVSKVTFVVVILFSFIWFTETNSIICFICIIYHFTVYLMNS